MPRRFAYSISAWFRYAAALAACLAPFALPAKADQTLPSGPPPTAAQIFDRAIAFVRSQNYPPYVTYIITVRTSAKGRWLVEQFQSVCRTRDDRVQTYGTPVSTTNHPDNPYKFTLKLKGLAIHDSPNIDEPFGLPELSPVYSFGLLTLHPAASSLHEYDVSLVGEEQLDDHKVYHLSLTPVERPKANRVRDLWIDSQTFAIWKLDSAGAFASGPATSVPWTVRFAIDRGHWFIDSEETTTPMLLGGYAPPLNSYIPVPGATKYDGVSYSFLSLEFPKSVGDYVFLENKPSQAVQM